MIESISTRDLANRLGVPSYTLTRKRPFSAYKIGDRLRFSLESVKKYERELLNRITTKYSKKDIDFKFDNKDLSPLLVSANEVREKWNISPSTQNLWISSEKTGRYPTTTRLGKSRYFIRAEVSFIEKGLAGESWRSRRSDHAQAERIIQQ